jgi:hypothetical protein
MVLATEYLSGDTSLDERCTLKEEITAFIDFARADVPSGSSILPKGIALLEYMISHARKMDTPDSDQPVDNPSSQTMFAGSGETRLFPPEHIQGEFANDVLDWSTLDSEAWIAQTGLFDSW